MKERIRRGSGSEQRLLSDIVVALAADYDRRKRAVCERSVSKRVRMEYVYINSRMLEAAGEIVGVPYAETFIREIGGKIGYARSEFGFCSEATYKSYKSQIKRNIARKLYLSD